jgi:hypothetical protein
MTVRARACKSKVKTSRYCHSGDKWEKKYSTYSFLTSALDGVSSQRHALVALYPRGKDPRFPFDRRLGGPQSWYGHRGSLLLPGNEPLSSLCPVCSQTLYWLSYSSFVRVCECVCINVGMKVASQDVSHLQLNCRRRFLAAGALEIRNIAAWFIGKISNFIQFPTTTWNVTYTARSLAGNWELADRSFAEERAPLNKEGGIVCVAFGRARHPKCIRLLRQSAVSIATNHFFSVYLLKALLCTLRLSSLQEVHKTNAWWRGIRRPEWLFKLRN